MMAAKLTPKMSVLEVTDANGGHNSIYIQRALLSANLKTTQEAMSFLNKLQIMEDGDSRNSPNRQQTIPRPERSSSSGLNKNAHYRQRYQSQNVRYKLSRSRTLAHEDRC
jgi:hypothetical protein